MNLKQVMQQLEKSGTETYKKIWPRHGIQPPLFGVKYADLYKLQKKIGCDHELAQGLWRTGNHDARILATLIVDADALTSRELDSWLGSAGNHVLNERSTSTTGRRVARPRTPRRTSGRWPSATPPRRPRRRRRARPDGGGR